MAQTRWGATLLRIVIVERDTRRRQGLAAELRMCGYEVIQLSTVNTMAEGANNAPADVVCLGDCGRDYQDWAPQSSK